MAASPYGELFGRRLKVTVGSVVVCDLDPLLPEDVNEGRNLNVDFTCETHARPEPLKTELTIYGLSKVVRDAMDAANDAARATAWQAYMGVELAEVLATQGPGAAQLAGEALVSQGATVKIVGGYQQDAGLLSRALILPDGLTHERVPGSPGWVTRIQAQCNRLPWANAFVSQPIAPGMGIADYVGVMAVVDKALAGFATEPELQATGYAQLVRRKQQPGFENGGVMHGLTRDNSKWLWDALGIRPVFHPDGTLSYVNMTAYTPDAQSVVLKVPGEFEIPGTPETGGLLTYKKLARGFYEIHALLNHRIFSSTQVVLLDELGKPLGAGGGVYRVEHATHTGSSYSEPFYTDAILRPVAIQPTMNF